MTKIFTACALRFAHVMSATLRFRQHRARKFVRQSMLANDDLRVDTEIAGPAQNFDNPSNWGRTRAWKSQQLHIHHSAIQLQNSWSAFSSGFDTEFLPQLGCELFPWRNFNLMCHAGVVRQSAVASRAVSKQSNNGWVRAVQNAKNPSFRALP